MNDANIEKAALVPTQPRMRNARQTCICAKRLIVTEKIADEFVALVTHKIETLQQGNPLQAVINIGPLARLDLADQVKKSIQQGSKLILGGNHEQCNFQPTLIDFVDCNNIAFKEETFGPVATIIRVKDENDAIAFANNHRYGLAATIWTEDHENAYHLARKLEAGTIFVNAMVRSDSTPPLWRDKKIRLW